MVQEKSKSDLLKDLGDQVQNNLEAEPKKIKIISFDYDGPDFICESEEILADLINLRIIDENDIYLK